MVSRGGRLEPLVRGGIYWADLEPVLGHEQGGTRPVLVLSHDVFNERSGTVIAFAITSQQQSAGYPLTWKVPTGLLPRESWVKISQIRTLSSERLSSLACQLDEPEMDQVVRGLLQLIA